MSPDLNPCEPIFLKLRCLLRKKEYQDLAEHDMQTAVLTALEEITPQDIFEFFKGTSGNYMNL